MFGKLFIIALRNMRRQLRRAIFTALSFAVAVFIYTVLIAVPVSMDRIADGASKGLRLIVTERNNHALPAAVVRLPLALVRLGLFPVALSAGPVAGAPARLESEFEPVRSGLVGRSALHLPCSRLGPQTVGLAWNRWPAKRGRQRNAARHPEPGQTENRARGPIQLQCRFLG